MSDNIDFKDLWQKQPVNPPNIDELFLKLRQFKKTNLIRLVLTNIVLMATSVFILWVWYRFQPELITTKLGIAVIILTMLFFLFYYNKLLPTLTDIDNKQSTNDYLQNLISFKEKQHYLQTKILNLYFVLLPVGLCLYMYEYVIRMTLFAGIFTYVLTLAWIGFNWFYMRPKKIQQQQAKLDEIIQKFEQINQQLK